MSTSNVTAWFGYLAGHAPLGTVAVLTVIYGCLRVIRHILWSPLGIAIAVCLMHKVGCGEKGAELVRAFAESRIRAPKQTDRMGRLGRRPDHENDADEGG